MKNIKFLQRSKVVLSITIGLFLLGSVFVGIQFWRKRALTIRKAGGRCDYRNFSGVCKITSILDEGEDDRNKSIGVRFEFEPTGRLDLNGTFLENNPNSLKKGGSETVESLGLECIDNLGHRWLEEKALERCGIVVGSEFDCVARVLERGTCSPVTFEFLEQSELKENSFFDEKDIPKAKISPDFVEEGPGEWAKNSDGTYKIKVSFFEDVNREDAKKVLSNHRGQIEAEFKISFSYYVSLPSEEIIPLAKEEEVKFIGFYPPPPVTFN